MIKLTSGYTLYLDPSSSLLFMPLQDSFDPQINAILI